MTTQPMRPSRAKPVVRPEIEEMKQRYFWWLYNGLFDYYSNGKYSLLCCHLFKREFRWSVPNDDNRAADGIEYRGKWAVSYFKTWEIWWDGPCTVFEMLVGLSERMESILENPVRESNIRDWFLLMIGNLSFKSFTDGNWSSDVEKIVDEKLNIFMDRKYDRYGNGGLFPVERTSKDQRKVEIWYQLMKYIDESFEI